MGWTWDEDKNEANKRKHGISFEAAQYVFDDPLLLSRLDSYPDEERWQTIGSIDPLVLVVVHTWPEQEGAPGRIISARRATPRERKDYEDGNFS
jgi:uncharacterized DUF497 family protein